MTENIKTWGKRTTEGMQSTYYNYLSNKAAFQALKEIEKEKGSLNQNYRRNADDYAVEVLGSKIYAPWLYAYTALAGTFKEGWIPDNYYHLVAIPKIQGDYGKISFLKPLNRKIFNDSISPDIAFFIHGDWYNKDYLKIDKKKLAAISFLDGERIVFKADQSYQGRGVFIRNKANFEIVELETKGNGTLQRYIEQHTFFNNFHSGSVANIRMTTVIDSAGNADVRAAYLRMGRSVDTHVRSDSHIRVPIDLISGELAVEGYLANWKSTKKHPDTMTPFAKKTVPNYLDCVQLVSKLHQSFPMVKAIGWDIIVDSQNRPVLMEWNGYGNDIKFSEATQGPCFKDLNWNNPISR